MSEGMARGYPHLLAQTQGTGDIRKKQQHLLYLHPTKFCKPLLHKLEPRLVVPGQWFRTLGHQLSLREAQGSISPSTFQGATKPPSAPQIPAFLAICKQRVWLQNK